MFRVTVEIVAQHDRVPALLGGPAPDPVEPRAVALPEHPVDESVVRGQVVLGQQPDLEAGLGHAGQARLIRRPGLLVEVPAEPVGDEVVGEPLLGHARVAVVQAMDLRLELDEEGGIVHVRGSFDRHGSSVGLNARRAGTLRAYLHASSALQLR